MTTRLDLEQLEYRYRGSGEPAVADLSLTIEPGELVALLGPSGCGKTTVLKLVSGLLRPARGDIRADGASVLALPPEAREFALVFQQGRLFEHMSVAGNVGFGLHMRRWPRERIERAVAAALDDVRLTGLERRRPRELSGGQRQRVALARALVTQPRAILLDEPLTALDAGLREQMRDLVRTLQRSEGRTMLFVTHDQQEAVTLADRVALVLDGRIEMFDTPRACYRRPATRRAAEFFGATNFLAGQAAGADRVMTAVGELALARAVAPQGCTVVIRPESIRLGSGPNTLDTVVDDATFRGNHTRYRLRHGGVTLVADLPVETGLERGDDARIHLPPEALWPLPEDAGTAASARPGPTVFDDSAAEAGPTAAAHDSIE